MDPIIGSLLIVGSALVAPTTYIPVAQAAEREPTLQEVAEEVARDVGIGTSTLFNLVYSESRWSPNAVGDGGQSYGLVQIHLGYNPSVTMEQALDPVFALKFAAERIKAGKQSIWTACNCYSLVKVKTGYLPRMANIWANSYAAPGHVAIFYYGKVKHVAYVTKVMEDGFWVQEANYKPCLIEKRFVSWNDGALVGFWSASP